MGRLDHLKGGVRNYWWLGLLIGGAVFLVVLALLVILKGNATELLAQDLLITIVLGIAGFILAALFGHKIKPLAEKIGTRACDACQGGQVKCTACQGSAKVLTEVDSLVACTGCGGTGRVTAQCPQCTGRTTIARAARFSVIGPTSSVRFEANPLRGVPLGHWQIVTAGVVNLEALSVSFGVTVRVPGSSTTESLSATLNLGPNASQTSPFEFKIHGGVQYPATVDITPAVVTETCPRCGGRGAIDTTCSNCAGSGNVPSRGKTETPCDRCSGQGTVSCPTCKGKGRVPRVD